MVDDPLTSASLLDRSPPARRICSLLPSATEIVYALGLEDRLAAVTHECDFPPQVASKPHITSSVIDSEGMTAVEIDQAVRDSLADQATIYYLDHDLLARLEPDLILTQELCDVCAVGPPIVQEAIASLPARPRVVSLEPHTLGQMLGSILLVGRLTGTEDRARDLVSRLTERIDGVRKAVAAEPRVPVLTLEWVDPLFVGGHWVPEMVEIAGGYDVLGQIGSPSRAVSWDDVVGAEPQVIVAMPCGFGLERSIQELRASHLPPAWNELPAVRSGEVYVVDGSSYFNRPGPRLVDGLEIMAAILHPAAFDQAPGGSFARFSAVAEPTA